MTLKAMSVLQIGSQPKGELTPKRRGIFNLG